MFHLDLYYFFFTSCLVCTSSNPSSLCDIRSGIFGTTHGVFTQPRVETFGVAIFTIARMIYTQHERSKYQHISMYCLPGSRIENRAGERTRWTLRESDPRCNASSNGRKQHVLCIAQKNLPTQRSQGYLAGQRCPRGAGVRQAVRRHTGYSGFEQGAADIDPFYHEQGWLW
jgi:hypothetical protein